MPPVTGPVVVLAQPHDQVVNEGQSAVLTVDFTGSAPLEMLWFGNGLPIPS